MAPRWQKFLWFNIFLWFALNAVWWFYLQFLPDHATFWNYVFNAAYGVPYLLAGVYMLIAAWDWRREKYPDTIAIGFLGASMIAYAIAQFIWTYYNLNANIEVPSPAPPDIFYVSSFVVQIVALTILMFHRIHKKPFSRWLTAGVMTATVVLSLLVTTLVFYSASLPNPLLTLDALYIGTSIVIVFLTLLNLHREWHAELRLFLFMNMLAAAAGGFANLLYAVEINANTYWNGDLADGLFALSGVLFFLSCVWIPHRLKHSSEGIESETGLARLQLLLPAAILVLGLLIGSRVAVIVYENGFETVGKQTELETAQVGQVLQEQMDEQMIRLESLAAFFRGNQSVDAEGFAAFVDDIRQDGSDVASFAFIDANRITRFSTDPTMIGRDVNDDEERNALFSRAEQNEGPVASEPVIRFDGLPGEIMYEAIRRNGQTLGVVAAAIRLSDFFDANAELLHQTDFDFLISSSQHIIGLDGRTVYDEDGKFSFGEGTGGMYPGATVPPEASSSFELTVADRTWTLNGWPNGAGYQLTYSETLTTFLAIILIDIVLAAVVYLILAQQSKLRRDLYEKTRALREHVEQLGKYKFYLDSVREAVVVGDARGRIVYANHAVEGVSAFSAPSLMGRDLSAFLGREAPSKDVLEKRLLKEGKWEAEIGYRGRGGGKGDMIVTLQPLEGDHGERVGTLLVARDITDRKNVERAKTQFVSLVSHQLRAPMTQLRWLVEQLLDSKLSKAAKESLSDMEQIIMEENHLVGDLLNVSRIERGVLKINADSVRAGVIAQEAVRPLQKAASDAGVKLVVNDLSETAMVFVDQQKAAEAIRNIVDNAIKFSPKGGAVSIDTFRHEHEISISIQDQGTGIPEEMWETLFEIKTTMPQSPGAGAGLGLYLSKKFIEAMGGRISFQTSGSGTIFLVSFPLSLGRPQSKQKPKA